MQRINRNTNIKYIICFVASLISQMLIISGPRQARVVHDDIGILATAAKLAGYDWSEVVHTYTNYYGVAYSALLAPLLYLIRDPAVLWTVIVYLNLILVAVGAVITYHIGVKYLGFKQNWVGIAFAVFSTLAFETSPDMGNEQCLFLTTVLFCWIMLELYESADVKKQLLLQTLVLLLFGFIYLCHSRAIVFLPVILCCVLWARFRYNKRLGFISIWIVGFACIYKVAKVIQKIAMDVIWGANQSGGTGLGNASLDFSRAVNSDSIGLTRLQQLKGIVVTFVGLAFRANVQTLCVFSLAIVLLLALIFGRKHSESNNKRELILLISLLCACAGILGISVIWGSDAAVGVAAGEEVYAYKGIVYWRYFGVFLGPAIYIALSMFADIENSKSYSITAIATIGISMLVCIVWYFVTWPVMVNTTYSYSSFYWMFGESEKEGLYLHSMRYTIMLVGIFLIMLFWAYIKRMDWIYIISVAMVMIIPVLSNESIKPYHAICNDHCDTGLELVRYLDERNEINDTLYLAGEWKTALNYQFSCMTYHITEQIPDNAELIFANHREDMISGYSAYVLDENETVYVLNGNQKLKECVEQFIKDSHV